MLVFLFQWAIHPAAFRAQILTSVLWVVVSGSGQLCVSPAGCRSVHVCFAGARLAGWWSVHVSSHSHLPCAIRVRTTLVPFRSTFLSSYDPSGPFWFPGSSLSCSALQTHIYTQCWGHGAGGTGAGKINGGLSHYLRPTAALIGQERAPLLNIYVAEDQPSCSAVHSAAIDRLGAGPEEDRGGKRDRICASNPPPQTPGFQVPCLAPGGLLPELSVQTRLHTQGWAPLPGSRQRWGSGRCAGSPPRTTQRPPSSPLHSQGLEPGHETGPGAAIPAPKGTAR